LDLTPIPIEIELHGALSKQNIRINTPSTFTVGISTRPEIMLNAAERLLGLTVDEIRTQAIDIILGQMRLVIATLSIEEINQDRERFLQLVNEHVATELHKIGLELINVNIKDIYDESGYIEAIGKKSAAEAINRARVEVAEQEKFGSIGEAQAKREKEIKVAKLMAEAEEGKKEAEAHKRIRVSQLEAEAIAGENTSKAQIAEYEASLHVKQAEAFQKSRIAEANAQKAIIEAEKEVEQNRLQKEILIPQQIQKEKMRIEAEAQALQQIELAKGEAQALLQQLQAQAEGELALLQAKATGYSQLVKAVQEKPELAATLLLIEKLETLVDKQVEAISKLKIDKITVWDSGNGQSTTQFIRGLISSLPPLHELAKQAGVELPHYLGSLINSESKTNTNPSQ
jgi:flotillin